MTWFNQQEYLEKLRTIVSMDGGSFDPQGVDQVAEQMALWYEELGFSVVKKRFDPRAGLCLEIRNHPEAADIDLLCSGHMDTVFPKGTVAQYPFRLDQEKAYGCGTIDMKSGLLNMYFVVRQLARTHPHLKLCMALNSDEEISSRYANPWISELASHARAGLVFEASRDNGDLVRARKGLARYEVKFHGVAVHAGVNPLAGASAIHEAAHWITRLEPLMDFPAVSVNVGVIEGGMGANTVAESCRFELDVRYVEQAGFEKVKAVLDDLHAHPINPRVTSEITRIGYRPPLRTAKRAEWLMDALQKEGKALGLDFQFVLTGGVSDANFIGFAGCPVIDGVGPTGGGEHSTREFLWLDSIEPRTRMVYNALVRLDREGYFKETEEKPCD